MECPKCKSNSLTFRESYKVCGMKECTYVDIHPVSYENDVLHYEGEDHRFNRYTTAYSNNLSNGGINIEREASFDKNYRTGKKVINDMCLVLRLSEFIARTAEARFLSILKHRLKSEESATEENEKNISIKNQAAYALYSACFEAGDYCKENSICNYLRLPMVKWRQIVYTLNLFLKDKIDFVPELLPIHLVKRVCKKRKINHAEQSAMGELLNRLSETGELGNLKGNTVAALVFWKICEYSSTYQKTITLKDICEKHERLEKEGKPYSEIHKYFDITAETVRKVFKDYLLGKFESKYLPQWETRQMPPRRPSSSQEDDEESM